MGIGPGAGSSRFTFGLVGSCGGSTAGESVEDLMQNPALGEGSKRTRVEDVIQDDVNVEGCGLTYRSQYHEKCYHVSHLAYVR